MSDQNLSTAGFRRITRLAPTLDLRLVVFAIAVALGLLLVLWLQAGVGRQMAHLEAEFAALSADGFHLGVETHLRLLRLNDKLLGYRLDQNTNPADLESFRSETAGLKQWLTSKEKSLSTAAETNLLRDLRIASERYFGQAERLLQASDSRTERATFADTYDAIEEQSKPLLDLVDQFVKVQNNVFKSFLQVSQETLLSLRRLLNLSLILLLVAVVTLAVLVYRGMIAPLRRRLTESRAIIERQEKLASLGTLAAGVAHEIRNPLTAIKLRLFSLNQALPAEIASHEDALVINTEINRLDRIVKNFLQFARPGEPELARVFAHDLLDEVHHLLAPELEKAGIVLNLVRSEAAWLHADAQQLKQVLINLIQNAADSIGRNGTIALRVTTTTAALDGRSRPALILSVADTGQGIPPEVEKRLFDPFFSTKENGTGLGLAIAARIAEKHGGLLRYRTQLKRGTTFEIVLPRIEDDATATAHRRG